MKRATFTLVCHVCVLYTAYLILFYHANSHVNRIMHLGLIDWVSFLS